MSNNYNPNFHHRQSIRLKNYDYSKAGLYYITIFVKDRKWLFGKIVGVNDGVNDDIEGVENFQPLQSHKPINPLQSHKPINPIKSHKPINTIKSRHRQRMILNDAGKIADECWLEIPKHFPNAVLHHHIVMPDHVHGIIELIEPIPMKPNHNEFQKIIPNSIGSIVRGFKIGVTKWFRNNTDIQNIWQRNFYERIIRNEKSYHNISEYIINNPDNWNRDEITSEY